ncbi:MAG TPA: TA system VapC family ribonuclease toxin [Acidobacteriaceae bacterium]
MSSLSFPDINVWLALATVEHVHARVARAWWKQEDGRIAFLRFTQLGLLRLMTTAAAMDGKPLSVNEAWRVHDRFFSDDRVEFVPEAPRSEERFRKLAAGRGASPKIWADAWLLAAAQAAGGLVVTFDRALEVRGALCLLPVD